MSYLETKRNALLNSVASSSGGIEYIDTVTISEDTEKINFNVDTSTFNTFFIVGDIVFNNASGNYIYFGVNNTTPKYYGPPVTQTLSIPNNSNMPLPFIVRKSIEGTVAFSFSLTNSLGQIINTNWEDVTQITLGKYSSSRYANGTQLAIYGMRESLTDIGE